MLSEKESSSPATGAAYFPPSGDSWQKITPEEAGMDSARLMEVADFAEAHESTTWPRTIANEQGIYDNASITDPPQWNELIGPVKPRGAPNGVILRHGRIVAEWGDMRRADMTFSISKSYLSLIAALALQDGLIRDFDDTVRSHGLDDGFDAEQNQAITWRHLLHQTSEWEGTLWGKPDLADRNRSISGDNSLKGTHRDLREPGSFWEYNDVRVNRLSLSLLRLFRRPLPEVLRERIMNPIGASQDWEWPTYRNAVVEIEGRQMPSVPGGGHWGGGLWISSRDHARVGWLVRNGGMWAGRQIIEGPLLARLLEPSPVNPGYASLWWLNPGRSSIPAAPESCVFARGGGANLIVVDPEHDLVLVSRWVDSAHWNTIYEMIMASLRD
ncbi:MAG: serine hydrolase [SAR324 cluster bacterium]|nr:serine hydrolase [SAR324 cluster bacterium]